ncbi:Hypothetical predicted protein [Olea europaea subsp. europaea]|uniref:Aminotransferase-like plant mobile domain-containing protein n=1 Tax=Olea europaea subsp. europaea TaxID=158383 RepID=A0A8S0R4F2_OLEEU|nr:Hypothetical predicted protein [Olea europaea subsp. europaea]
MNKAALLVAVSLSKSTKLALAPAIIADIYRILSTLKGALVTHEKCKMRQGKKKAIEAKVTTPFQLTQASIWERFPTIGSMTNLIGFGGPRLAQWHIIMVVGTKKLKCYLHKMALKKNQLVALHEFWKRLLTQMVYKENYYWELLKSSSRDEFEGLVRCLRPRELVSLEVDCIE